MLQPSLVSETNFLSDLESQWSSCMGSIQSYSSEVAIHSQSIESACNSLFGLSYFDMSKIRSQDGLSELSRVSFTNSRLPSFSVINHIFEIKKSVLDVRLSLNRIKSDIDSSLALILKSPFVMARQTALIDDPESLAKFKSSLKLIEATVNSFAVYPQIKKLIFDSNEIIDTISAYESYLFSIES